MLVASHDTLQIGEFNYVKLQIQKSNETKAYIFMHTPEPLENCSLLYLFIPTIKLKWIYVESEKNQRKANDFKKK